VSGERRKATIGSSPIDPPKTGSSIFCCDIEHSIWPSSRSGKPAPGPGAVCRQRIELWEEGLRSGVVGLPSGLRVFGYLGTM
jgi:hypothetical protein